MARSAVLVLVLLKLKGTEVPRYIALLGPDDGPAGSGSRIDGTGPPSQPCGRYRESRVYLVCRLPGRPQDLGRPTVENPPGRTFLGVLEGHDQV